MGKPSNDGSNLVVNEQFVEIVLKVGKFFDGDVKKTRFWLVTANPNFGFIAPLKLIVMGKGDKVLQFIDDAADESILEEKEPREWWAELKNMCLWNIDEKPAPHRDCVKVREVIDSAT